MALLVLPVWCGSWTKLLFMLLNKNLCPSHFRIAIKLYAKNSELNLLPHFHTSEDNHFGTAEGINTCMPQQQCVTTKELRQEE